MCDGFSRICVGVYLSLFSLHAQTAGQSVRSSIARAKPAVARIAILIAYYCQQISVIFNRLFFSAAGHSLRSCAAPAKPSDLYSASLVPSVRLAAFKPTPKGTHHSDHGPYKEAQAPNATQLTSFKPDYYPQSTCGDLSKESSSKNKASHISKMWNNDTLSAISQHSNHIAPDTGHQIRGRNAQTVSVMSPDPNNTLQVRKNSSLDKRNDATTDVPNGQGAIFVHILLFYHTAITRVTILTTTVSYSVIGCCIMNHHLIFYSFHHHTKCF